MKEFLVMASLIGTSALAMGIDIVKDGKPCLEVYTLKKEGKPQAFSEKMTLANKDYGQIILNSALHDLGHYVARISGAKLKFKEAESASEIPEKAIVIGKLAEHCKVYVRSQNEYGDAFRIQADDKRIYILGGGKSGTGYGIYEFLNRLGVEWLFPEEIGEVIPNSKDILFAPCEIDEAPSFKMRSPWLPSYRRPEGESEQFKLWQIRNKAQYDRHITPQQMQGGHNWANYTLPQYDRYFEKNPEIAALVHAEDGTPLRNRSQIDTTVPAALEMVADFIKEEFRRNKWPKDKFVTISIGPNDGGGFSETDAARALVFQKDPITGEPDRTDMMVQFANRLLERLTPEYPNLHLGFYLYHCYEGIPLHFKPHPNLSLQVADISYSRFHGMCDAAVSPQRAFYKNVLAWWSNNKTTMTLYHYNWNLADAILPYSRLRIIGNDIPAEYEMGIHGYGCEYTPSRSISAPHDYLQAKLMWNAGGNWKKITRHFCEKAYGAGAREMEEYLMFLCAKQANCSDETGSFFSYPLLYSREDASAMRKLITKAMEKAETDVEKFRIRMAMHPVSQLENLQDFYHALWQFDYSGALTAYEKMYDLQAERAKSEYGPGLYSEWALDFLKFYLFPTVSSGKYYSTEGYRILAKLPDRMKVMFDPENAGEKMNFYSPLLHDESFMEMSTYRSTISRQGQIGFRSGTIWYRCNLALPVLNGLKEGKGIGLFIGGGDHIVTAYVNGVKTGTVSGFLKPAVWDITDLVDKNGKSNSIVISVRRNANNEAGTGGLMFPSFIFSGKRVPQTESGLSGKYKPVLPGVPQE